MLSVCRWCRRRTSAARTGLAAVLFDRAAPEAGAVAAAVAELKARRLDPQAIRREAMALLAEDRQRLMQLIRAIYQNEGKTFPEHADWDQLYRRGTWPVAAASRLMTGSAVSETTPAAPTA
jgi:hypothetical protein